MVDILNDPIKKNVQIKVRSFKMSTIRNFHHLEFLLYQMSIILKFLAIINVDHLKFRLLEISNRWSFDHQFFWVSINVDHLECRSLKISTIWSFNHLKCRLFRVSFKYNVDNLEFLPVKISTILNVDQYIDYLVRRRLNKISIIWSVDFLEFGEKSCTSKCLYFNKFCC